MDILEQDLIVSNTIVSSHGSSVDTSVTSLDLPLQQGEFLDIPGNKPSFHEAAKGGN